MNELYGPQPCYGERGALTHVGGMVQCHICGKAFHHLGNHVARTHEITADQYCDEFGLRRSTGLISDALAEKRRSNVGHLLEPDMQRRSWVAAAAAPRRKRTSRKSLEERRSAGYADRMQRFIALGQANLRQRIADGTYVPPMCDDPAKYSELGRRKFKEHLRDPKFAAAWKAKLSAARLVPVTRECSICGVAFTTGRHKGKRSTCGEACHKEHKRRHMAAIIQRPEVRQNMSKAARRRMLLQIERGVFIPPHLRRRARNEE